MSVQARFFVDSILRRASAAGGAEVTLKASTRGPHDWSKWTPVGTLTMGTLNEDAAAWFAERLGRDVALTFDDAP